MTAARSDVAAERYRQNPNGDRHGFGTKTPKPAWRKNIWKDFGGQLPQWAIVFVRGGSVLADGDNWAPLAYVGKLPVRGQKDLKALQVAGGRD